MLQVPSPIRPFPFFRVEEAATELEGTDIGEERRKAGNEKKKAADASEPSVPIHMVTCRHIHHHVNPTLDLTVS
jgi:hypothetical protein